MRNNFFSHQFQNNVIYQMEIRTIRGFPMWGKWCWEGILDIAYLLRWVSKIESKEKLNVVNTFILDFGRYLSLMGLMHLVFRVSSYSYLSYRSQWQFHHHPDAWQITKTIFHVLKIDIISNRLTECFYFLFQFTKMKGNPNWKENDARCSRRCGETLSISISI